MPNEKKIEPYVINHSGSDYQWHAYCLRCPTVDGGAAPSVATAHTLDSVRLTKLVNAAVQHALEVHGGE